MGPEIVIYVEAADVPLLIHSGCLGPDSYDLDLWLESRGMHRCQDGSVELQDADAARYICWMRSSMDADFAFENLDTEAWFQDICQNEWQIVYVPPSFR